MSEQTDDLEQIKNNAGKNYGSQELHINRVPNPSVEKLKELASEKFSNDYGMTLAYLLELHELRNEFDDKLVNTNRKVVELEDELAALKNMIKNKDEKQSRKEDTLQ